MKGVTLYVDDDDDDDYVSDDNWCSRYNTHNKLNNFSTQVSINLLILYYARKNYRNYIDWIFGLLVPI